MVGVNQYAAASPQYRHVDSTTGLILSSDEESIVHTARYNGASVDEAVAEVRAYRLANLS